MAYIGQSLTEGTRRAYTFVATSGQTTFNAVYGVGAVDVYQNGILLQPSDYNSSSGSSVVLGVGAAVNDEITIIAHNTFSVADTVSSSQGGTFTGAVTASNGLTVDDDGATPLTVDRATDNGDIIDLQKDGTSVGNIAVDSNDNIMFGAKIGGGPGFYLTGSGGTTPFVLPMKENALSDNTVTLGDSSRRYKDIYLGGGLYVGGTGSANKLDDYEEGTWTPTSGVTHTYNYATYTKIGQLVYINIDVQCGSSSSTSALVFSTPFQALYSYNTGSFNYQTTSLNDATINLGPNGIYFRTGQSAGDMNYNQASNARLIFNAIYQTNA